MQGKRCLVQSLADILPKQIFIQGEPFHNRISGGCVGEFLPLPAADLRVALQRQTLVLPSSITDSISCIAHMVL